MLEVEADARILRLRSRPNLEAKQNNRDTNIKFLEAIL